MPTPIQQSIQLKCISQHRCIKKHTQPPCWQQFFAPSPTALASSASSSAATPEYMAKKKDAPKGILFGAHISFFAETLQFTTANHYHIIQMGKHNRPGVSIFEKRRRRRKGTQKIKMQLRSMQASAHNRGGGSTVVLVCLVAAMATPTSAARARLQALTC